MFKFIKNVPIQLLCFLLISYVVYLILKVPTEEKLTSDIFMKAICILIAKKDLPTECEGTDSGSETLVVGILPLLICAFYFIKLI